MTLTAAGEPGVSDSSQVFAQMSAMVSSHWIPQVIRAAIDLSLPEHLADASLTANQVAEWEGSAPGTTFRLMRACEAIGLLTADDEGRFSGTPLLGTLHRDTPGSLRGLALATTLPGQWLAWNAFTASVRAGTTQAAEALGTDLFDYLEHQQRRSGGRHRRGQRVPAAPAPEQQPAPAG